MGQAKARKEEINAIKANGFTRTLEAVGAFYKDDTTDGFAIVVERKLFGATALQAIADGVTECATSELAEFNSGNYQYFDAVDRTSAIANITVQLKEAADIFNKANGIDRTYKHIKQLTNVQNVSEMIVAMSNIQLLEQIGEIQPDNFNGMLYQTSLS